MPDKKDIPQRELGTVLRSFFNHVTSHDEEGVHAALCMVANAAPPEPGVPAMPAHICTFGAGDPDVLAQMMIMAIDTMIEDVPGFTEAWGNTLRAKHLQTMISQVIDVVQQAKEQVDEAKGMEAAKPQADELIARIKGSDTKH